MKLGLFEKVDSQEVVKYTNRHKEPNLQGSDLNEWRKGALNPDRSSLGILRNICARNPYALAERMNARLHKDPITWSETDFMANRNTLYQTLNCPYEELFDPRFKKSLIYPNYIYAELPEFFGGKHQSAQGSLANTSQPVQGSKIKVSQPVSPVISSDMHPLVVDGDTNTKTGAPTSGGGDNKQVQTNESPCTNTGDYWGIYNIPGTTNPAYYCKASVIPKRLDVIDDAVQGCTKNCYFIAALASVAFVKYTNFPVSAAKSALKDSYDITFYYPDGQTYRTITIGSDLVLESAGNTPVFSRPSTSNEVWPAIYEKAYGAFLVLLQSDLPFNGRVGCSNYPRPNLSDFAGGNPLESLEHITGASWVLNSTYFNTKDIPGKCFEKIWNANYSEDSVNGITRYPMVAWTYFTADDANTCHPNTKISYGSEILVANHSYSILGTVKNGGINYIVLRNPYGRLWGADPDDPVLKNYLYTGTWSPPSLGNCSAFSLPMTTIDGIFALSDDQFELYFQAFGWVQ
jgi:hypothetical protein